MSDFDKRLTAVLTTEAEHAPHPAGLARGARRRHVVRRRRRIGVGGVAAALVIAAPVAVLAGGGGDEADVASDPPPAGEWRKVTHDDVRAEIPGDWAKHTCDFDGFTAEVYGPTEEDACGFDTYLAFYGSATFDAAHPPGEIVAGGSTWGGYVTAGEWAVSTSTEDRDLTRRVLSSARTADDPEVVATRWRSHEGVDLRVEIPVGWGVTERGDYKVCAVPGHENDPPQVDWREVAARYLAGRWITVSAPTLAVGDLVLATVESEQGSDAVGCVG